MVTKVTNLVVKNVRPIIAIKQKNLSISPLIPWIAPNTAQPTIKDNKNILPLPNKATKILVYSVILLYLLSNL